MIKNFGEEQMNVFENLIDELKEENLLEETVIETQKAEETAYLGEVKLNFSPSEFDESPTESVESAAQFSVAFAASEFSSADLSETAREKDSINLDDELLVVGNGDFVTEAAVVQNFPAVETAKKKENFDEKEFYRKRAMEEVSGLQMVEHVLTGIEREQMKTAPKNYNDITVKKALHDFMKIAADVKSPEHAQAEFQLMQETETWCSALSHRDKRVSVAHLRRYCETTKPALSSQALISLARFYRNLPYSESVRSKFDFVVTKLFSKDDGDEKRVLVFSREELIQHLKELYADWSSISLYSIDDDNSSIVLAALKFEDFIGECENAENFDELVRTDFFNRLRLFKESTNEIFFAPLVTASAIECNARIGNRFVDLIRAEREKKDAAQMQDKYGFTHDQSISDATSKTLQMVELLREISAREKSIKTEKKLEQTRAETVKSVKSKTETAVAAATNRSVSHKTSSRSNGRAAENYQDTNPKTGLAGNKWLLSVVIFVVLASAAIYFYQGSSATGGDEVKKVNLQNSSLKEFLESASISDNAFNGVTSPVWDSLPNEKKEAILKKILAYSSSKDFSKVQLLDKAGKTVGTASGGKVEVITP